MKAFLLLILLLLAGTAFAQDESTREDSTGMDDASVTTGLQESIDALTTAVEGLRKIKITGYLQSQFQVSNGRGPLVSGDPAVGNFAGGNFPPNGTSRFRVRRGRLKVQYDNDLTQSVLQIDATQNGVGIKDAYIRFRDPWKRWFSLTAGIFDRPFGFEISYSSSSRESAERSRIFQTLFPGERDLGAMIEFSPEIGPLSVFNLKAGLFNGVLPTAPENDASKDVIGRIGLQLPFDAHGLSIDGGVSIYVGKVTNNSSFVYTIGTLSGVFPPRAGYHIDSSSANRYSTVNRKYYGGDLQIYYDFLGGLSVRGEYIFGNQPGSASSNAFYNPSAPNTHLYLRKFAGWYLTYIHNIGVRHQFVSKLDWYDPNTGAEGNDVTADTGPTDLSIADIGYLTTAFGWIFHLDANIKFVAYYEVIRQERIHPVTGGPREPYIEDVNDDVFTFRIQYKF